MEIRHNTANHSRASLRFIVGWRWALLFAAPFMFELSNKGAASPWMWVVLLLFAASNLSLHLHARNQAGQRQRWFWYPSFAADLLLISASVVLRGGVRSDTYLLYLLIACEAGILLTTWEAWAVGLIAAVAYAGAVLSVNGPDELKRVLIRTVYLGLAAVVTTYLAAAEQRATVEALTDSKTNLPNARLFQDALAEAVAHHSRLGTPLSVAIMDVDNFRQLNATIGHPMADKVLEQLAEVLVAWKRPEDIIARYGGEEFIFLLPGQDLPAAAARLDLLRQTIADRVFFLGPQMTAQITISGGVTSMETARTISALLVTADRALLEAKAAGKNRIVSAAAEPKAKTPGA